MGPRDPRLGDVWRPCQGPCVSARAACPPRVGACVSAWFPSPGSLLVVALWLQVGPAVSGCLVGSAQGGGDLSL